MCFGARDAPVGSGGPRANVPTRQLASSAARPQRRELAGCHVAECSGTAVSRARARSVSRCFRTFFGLFHPLPGRGAQGGGRAGPTGRAEGQRANAPPCRLAHPSADQLPGCTLPSVRNRCFARARTLDVAASQNLTTLLQGRASARFGGYLSRPVTFLSALAVSSNPGRVSRVLS